MSQYSITGQSMHAPSIAPGLYIVATPIGNLKDITLRALQVLAATDIIACEDKRISTRLLNHYGIRSNLLSYHEHNAQKAGAILMDRLADGGSVALISDAGTPLISDPGHRLIKQAYDANIPVWPIPGPSAAITALSACVLPTDSFLFCGFLPPKHAARCARLKDLSRIAATLVFYESPKRLTDTLADMRDIFGAERNACICRELTKLHEEKNCGTIDALVEKYVDGPVKGEIVILVAPFSGQTEVDPDEILRGLLAEMSVSRAAAEAAKITGMPRRALYSRALQLSNSDRQDK
jgi:16S rRNA (cytidine1402-2'-O)-methyltransferase